MRPDGRWRAPEEYASHRPGYPDALFDRLAAVAGPARALAVDAGAGTGLSTTPLAARFARVIALEGDPEMAARIPRDRPSVEVRVGPVEEATLPPAGADLVSFGNSLHWMDAPRVLGSAAAWTRGRGAVAAWNYGVPAAAGPLGGMVLAEKAARWDPLADPRVRGGERLRRAFGECPALEVESVERVPMVVSMDAAALTGFFRSTSYGSAYAATLGDGAAYWADLERRWTAAAGPDPLPVDFALTLVVGRAV